MSLLLFWPEPPPNFAARQVNAAQRAGGDFFDDFDDNSLAAMWTPSSAGVILEQNQRLEIVGRGAADTTYDSVVATGIDLTNRSIYWRMPVGVQFTSGNSKE